MNSMKTVVVIMAKLSSTHILTDIFLLFPKLMTFRMYNYSNKIKECSGSKILRDSKSIKGRKNCTLHLEIKNFKNISYFSLPILF